MHSSKLSKSNFAQALGAALQRQLGANAVATFYQQYWQRQPLYLAGVFDTNLQLATPGELYQLAANDEVESRLVCQQQQRFQLSHGPFSEPPLDQRQNSILLIQAADHYLDNASQLLQGFDFVPSWILDDLMISIANQGGSVGPHFDRYDVFLVQGPGQRLWQVGNQLDQATELSNADGLALLPDAEFNQQYLCNPGDVLYIPPLHPHHGIAHSHDSQTYSVGCRTPSTQDVLQQLLDSAPDSWSQPMAFRPTPASTDLNEATRQFQQQLLQQLQQHPLNKGALANLFTTPKYEPNLDWEQFYLDELLDTQKQWCSKPLPQQLHNDVRVLLDDQHLSINGLNIDCSGSALSCAQHLARFRCLPEHSQLDKDEDWQDWQAPRCNNASQLITLLLCTQCLDVDN